jgi:PAS domain S-box-containing protein
MGVSGPTRAGMISLLYVDDEESFLQLTKRYIERGGTITVDTAESAEIALQKLKSNNYDAVVSDYQMPVMNGIEFLTVFRKEYPTLPFIIFTGKGREEIAIEAFEKGADSYIQKGGEPKSQFAELVHKVQAAVDQRKADAQVTVLNRLYTVLSATTKAVANIHDKKALLNEICRIVIEIGGLKLAWAGLVNPEKHSIEPTAAYDYSKGYLDTIAISTLDIPRGRGPTGTAFREGKFTICNDIEHDPMMVPWRDGALERGYRSVAAFPFALDTKNAGVITFYASEPGFFNEPIIRLLDEQSKEVSSALLALDREEQRIDDENELKKSELRYRRLFETAQDAILILDGDTGKIIDANKFILDMLGFPLEYLKGKQLWEVGFIKDQSIAQKAFTELKTNGYIRYEDLPLETKDGRSMDVEFISNVYLVDNKKIIQCNIRDITERKRAEVAVQQANKKLNLLSGITRHDILNGITILKGYLDLAGDEVQSPEMQKYIDYMVEAVKKIQHQIEFTRQYQEIGVHAATWQDVRDMVQNVSSVFKMENVTLTIACKNLEIFADPLLEKVFYNLFENAFRYAPPFTTITVACNETGEGLSVVFADDGVGIPAEDKTKLFTKGFGKHTGLGLFLSREILAITGITITENGEAGKGARFEIGVPKGMYRISET